MKKEKGETITSREGIANVFGEFYSKLFAEERFEEEESHQEKELQMSSVNSTVSYLQKNDLKMKSMILTNQKQEQTKEEKQRI